MRRIAQLVADLLSLHGLTAEQAATATGRTRTSYRFPLVVRGTPDVLLDGDIEAAAVDDGAVLRLYLAAVDCGARAVYLHDGHAPPAAQQACGDRVTLWSGAEVATLLGATLWSAAAGMPLPPLPDGFRVAPAPPVPPAAPAVEAVPKPSPAGAPVAAETAEHFIDLDDAAQPAAVDLETGADVAVTTLPTSAKDELATAQPLMPEPPAAPVPLPPAFQPLPEPAPATAEPATAEEPPLFQMPPAFQPTAPPALPVPDGSRGLLPARLTLDDARKAVADRLFGIEEAELILQPVHLFDYTVDVLREGSLDSDAERGRIQVNGTDRKVTATDPAASAPPARVFATPDLVVMDKVLRVSPERAEQVAREWATARHGKTVHVPMSGADDSFDLSERRTVGPTSGQVTLTPLGIWHRPFWRLWGVNGHVDLDAVEGNVLDAEIKTPDPDVMLVE